MSLMFGDRLNEFVLSVDIMDETTFKDLMALVHAYVHEQLGVTYLSVLEETTIDGRTGLRTQWTTRDDFTSYTVGNENGYASHSAFVFGEGRPLWVVTRSKQPLLGADDLRDLWQRAPALPPYGMGGRNEARTSVMHPLRSNGRVFGVIEFASADHVEPTQASMREVETLASVVARAHLMCADRRVQRDNTRAALQALGASLRTRNWARLAKPRLFMAYPGEARIVDGPARDAHRARIQALTGAMKAFADLVDVVDWADIAEPGNISQQVIDLIGGAEFGVCYLSEPGADGGYADNANVLFEAGMMQALTHLPSAPLRAWLPIREAGTALPFDIGSERILVVPCDDDGRLQAEAFAAALRRCLCTMLGRADEDEDEHQRAAGAAALPATSPGPRRAPGRQARARAAKSARPSPA